MKTIPVTLHPLKYQKELLYQKAQAIPQTLLPTYKRGKYPKGCARIVNNEIQSLWQTLRKKKVIHLDKQVSSIVKKDGVIFLKFQTELIPIRVKAVDDLDDLLLNHYNSCFVWYDCGFQARGWRAEVVVNIKDKYNSENPDATIGIDLGMRHTCYSIWVNDKEIYRAFDGYGKTYTIMQNLKRLIAKKQAEFTGSRRQLSEYLKPFYQKRKSVLRQYYGTLRNRILSHIPENYNAVFVLEDLDSLPRNLLKKRQREWLCLELGNGILIDQIDYNGFKVVKVNPKGTTHTCWKCGQQVKSFPNRKIVCPTCYPKGLDRDLNGARNIARRYMLSSVGKHTCVPIEPIILKSQVQNEDNREKPIKMKGQR